MLQYTRNLPQPLGFEPFVAPAEWTRPEQFAQFGNEVDIYAIFNAYQHPNKAYAYTFSNAIATQYIPYINGQTYCYGYTIGSTDYRFEIVSGLIDWLSSTKRWVICNSSSQNATLPTSNYYVHGIIWLYVSKKISSLQNEQTFGRGNSWCKFIHWTAPVSIVGDGGVSRSFYFWTTLTGMLTTNNTIPIGAMQFGFSGISSVKLVQGVILGENPFVGTNISIINESSKFLLENNVLYEVANGVKKRLIYARRAVGIIDLSTENITLDNGCFYMSSITGFILPPTITSLGQLGFLFFGAGIFQNCTGITSLTLPTSLTSIGSSAFQDCSGITSLTLPNSLNSIGSSAFANCTSLTSLTITKLGNVTGMDATVFGGCTGVKQLYLPVGYSATYNDWRFGNQLATLQTSADVLAQSMINIAAGTAGNVKIIRIGGINRTQLMAKSSQVITDMIANLSANYKQLNASDTTLTTEIITGVSITFIDVASTAGYLVGNIMVGSTIISATSIISATRFGFAARTNIPSMAIGTVISEY